MCDIQLEAKLIPLDGRFDAVTLVGTYTIRFFLSNLKIKCTSRLS